MAALRPEDLDHLARIARLALAPEERDRLAREAALILAHFEAVQEVLGEPGAAEAPGGLEPRPDEVQDCEPAQVEHMVAQFPRKDGRLCKVPEGL